jgi:hypothetical protein
VAQLADCEAIVGVAVVGQRQGVRVRQRVAQQRRLVPDPGDPLQPRVDGVGVVAERPFAVGEGAPDCRRVSRRERRQDGELLAEQRLESRALAVDGRLRGHLVRIVRRRRPAPVAEFPRDRPGLCEQRPPVGRPPAGPGLRRRSVDADVGGTHQRESERFERRLP